MDDLLTLEGHKGEVRAVAFSPDGRLLASDRVDGSIRVWHGHPDTAKPAAAPVEPVP